jgi:phosphocarrier protein
LTNYEQLSILLTGKYVNFGAQRETNRAPNSAKASVLFLWGLGFLLYFPPLSDGHFGLLAPTGGCPQYNVNKHESEETKMKEFKHVIKDPLGLHARPAGMLVKAVAGYASKVTMTAPSGTADARRLMAVMRLAAKQGMELTFQIEGADEEKAAAELQAFLAENL